MRLRVTDIRTITDATPDVRDMEYRNASVTIGSHSGNLLQLPDMEIAAHHATLEPVGDGWVYRPTTREQLRRDLRELEKRQPRARRGLH